MADNDFLIGLTGGLDPSKSKLEIENDIKSIEGNLKKIKLQGEIDPSKIKDIEKQLSNLKATITDITVNPKALTNIVNQINNALKGIQISNISIGGRNGNNPLGKQFADSTAMINEFRKSLSNIGMSSSDIDKVINRINGLNVTIDSLNQSTSFLTGKKGDKNLLSVNVSGIDEFGQAIKLTETWDMDAMKLVKSIDAVSSATQKAGANTNNFAKQQKTTVANLTNQIKQINASAIDPNASRSITDTTHLSTLKSKYDEITQAIQKMESASADTFVDEQNNVKSLIADFKILVSEYRNAENISVNLAPDKLASGLSKAQSEFEALNAKIKNANVESPKLTENITKIETALSKTASGEILNQTELKEVFTALRNAKAELNALNEIKITNAGLEKLKLDANAAKDALDAFGKKNVGFAEYKTEINGVEVSVESLKAELDNVTNKTDFDVLKSKINAFKAEFDKATASVQNSKNLFEQVSNIKISVGTDGKMSSSIEVLRNNFTKLGLSTEEVKAKMQSLDTEFNTLQNLINQGASNEAIVAQFQKLQTALSQTQNNLKATRSEYSLLATEQQRLSKANEIEAWNQKNSRASKEVIANNEAYIASLRDLNSEMTKMQFNKINQGFKQSENSMRALGKLGASMKDQFTQAYQSFSMWLSASSAVMKVVSETREAVTELKEIDTLLTEISKANDTLTKSQLSDIGDNSFDVASKYGKSATDYLSGVQEASRAGYQNAEAIAELSTAAQGAGDMTAELANQMIIATDKAYKLGGSTSELTKILDGMNYITNHNAVNMTELSEGMSIVGSTAASFGIEANELTAALATMSATTQQSGSEVARAFRAILLNIRQVSDEEENIDAEGLTRYEQACNALGVTLKETVNGVQQLRDPMEVLKELSIEYNKLSEKDVKRTNLLNSVGGKLRSTQLDALLRQWSTYETMLQQYEDGVGSMAVEAEKTANSWEGSANRLGNTWTDIIENVLNSDAVIAFLNTLNNGLQIINKWTESLGSLGTIGVGAGLFAGLKNVGKPKMFGFNYCFEIADFNMCSLGY